MSQIFKVQFLGAFFGGATIYTFLSTVLGSYDNKLYAHGLRLELSLVAKAN